VIGDLAVHAGRVTGFVVTETDERAQAARVVFEPQGRV
jgi:hypothetical protein